MFRVRNHFNLTPAEYDNQRGGHLAARRYDIIRGALDARRDRTRTVVEFGVGTGRLLAGLAEAYPGLQFIGIDIEPKMVEYARGTYRRPNLRFLVTDITNDARLPHCEFAFSIDVIHHVHKPLRFFQAVHCLLGSGGSWLVIEPNVFHPYIYLHQERMRRAGFDEDHFRPWLLEPLMRDAGFTIELRRYAFAFPGHITQLPGVLASLERAIERFRFLGGSVIYSLQAQQTRTGYLS